MKKKKDLYEKHAADFRNEAEVEEEIVEDEGIELIEAERQHFEEDDDEAKAI